MGALIAQRRHGPAAMVIFVGLGLSLAFGAASALLPDARRDLIASLVAALVVLCAVRWPGRTAAATLMALPALGLARRVLSMTIGETTYDLLLLLPTLAAGTIVVASLQRERTGAAPDALTLLVPILLAWTTLEIANPAGGGVTVGVAGWLLVGAPLLWFLVGRLTADQVSMQKILVGVAVAGCISALYGLTQVHLGRLPWDVLWISRHGYAALGVFGALRAFSTFSSASEYAVFLVVALTVIVATVRRPLLKWPAAALVAAAIIDESSRGAAVFAILGVVAVAVLRARGGTRSGVQLIAAGIAILSLYLLAGSAGSSGLINSNPLLSHQVSGLSHPFDPAFSTLPSHVSGTVRGISDVFGQPLGYGPGPASLAGAKFGSDVLGTETDISDQFVSGGLIGGTLYLAIVGIVLVTLARIAILRSGAWEIAAAAIALATVGNWLNGAEYAVAPLIWYVIGWGTQRNAQRAVGREAPPAPSASSLQTG